MQHGVEERGHPLPRPFDGLRTIKDAVDYLNETLADQVDQSILDEAPPNTPITGDDAFKTAFWTLLPPEEQRTFFLRVAGIRKVWPRIKSLFGNPPFSFLRAEDEGVIRASSICKGRVRMAAEKLTTTSYSEFHPHFEDSAGRQYRLVSSRSDGLLPWVELSSGGVALCDVRVKKRKRDAKIGVLQGDSILAQASLMFPKVGESVRLSLVRGLWRPADDEPLTVRVLAGVQRSVGSPIARLGIRIC